MTPVLRLRNGACAVLMFVVSGLGVPSLAEADPIPGQPAGHLDGSGDPFGGLPVYDASGMPLLQVSGSTYLQLGERPKLRSGDGSSGFGGGGTSGFQITGFNNFTPGGPGFGDLNFGDGGNGNTNNGTGDTGGPNDNNPPNQFDFGPEPTLTPTNTQSGSRAIPEPATILLLAPAAFIAARRARRAA